MAEVDDGGTPQKLVFPPVPHGRSEADFDLFWSDWEPVVRRVARAKLRKARVPRALVEADDATHTVWVQVRTRWADDDFSTKKGEYKGPGRYALGAVLSDFVREQVTELKLRAGARVIGGDGEDLAAPEPGPEDLLIEQEVQRYLNEALEQLTDKQRQAIELTTAGELTREQIADQMGVCVGTVSGHRAKGLDRLIELLGPLLAVITPVIDWFLDGDGLFALPILFFLAAAGAGILCVRVYEWLVKRRHNDDQHD
ncbi:sigma-70 family RNA polymerase sigma factor [Actinoplanes sp. NPDC051633]|uniref:RNA polymerase sigma factor n=1 Tax=Actinoplanes sp. NPDC051633 TaxID=3155670 RepID=UPI0034200893